MKRLIIGISGASGAIYGVRLLQILRDVPDVETHLIMSQAARQTLALETEYSLREVQALADVVHDARDIAASISSGSFKTAGMVILPCSVKTLSGIVHSYTDGLLTARRTWSSKSVVRWYCACGKRRSISASAPDGAGGRDGSGDYAAGSGLLPSPANPR